MSVASERHLDIIVHDAAQHALLGVVEVLKLEQASVVGWQIFLLFVLERKRKRVEIDIKR